MPDPVAPPAVVPPAGPAAQNPPAKAPRAKTVLATFFQSPGPSVVTREAQVVGGKGDVLELVVPPRREGEKPLDLGRVARAVGEHRTPPFWVEAEEPEEPADPRGKKK